MSEGAGVNKSRITFRAENMRSLREQQHIRYGPGTNNSALLDEPTILLNRSEKTMQTTLDTVDMNSSSVVKTTLRLNVEHSMSEELMASFEDMLVEYIANWDAINMTEEEIRQRASQLPLDSSLQQSILNVLRELAPGDRSVSLARSLSVSQFSYTQARKSLVDGPQFTEKEVIALSREHKVARDASTAQAVRNLLHSKHRLQVVGALQHLQQIRDRMHTDRSREILQLDHARLIARPHVISRDFGIYQSYTCYLCRNVFSSIEFLQAHLLSLKHHRLCLSKERRQVVKWAMEEPKVPATVMNTTSAEEGQEGTGTETPSILPDPSNEAEKGTENEATGSKNNSVFELINKARNLKDVAENPNNTFAAVGVPSDASDDIINPMKNVVFAELFDEAQRIRLLKSKNAIVLDYGTCLFCGTKVDLSPLVEVHRCTQETTEVIGSPEFFTPELSPVK
ncbi:unnamed protein product [Dibothriocephalus latus]|uniref:C2H2-type domain-containing protein n=1 Tax=Dibothriocephalus latus TaxID=60516 RepID=A0A3P7LLP0_DIBLA|nr:unnamed protein product [Dibothriocephalus latus]